MSALQASRQNFKATNQNMPTASSSQPTHSPETGIPDILCSLLQFVATICSNALHMSRNLFTIDFLTCFSPWPTNHLYLSQIKIPNLKGTYSFSLQNAKTFDFMFIKRFRKLNNSALS